jgi:hypothetical protein
MSEELEDQACAAMEPGYAVRMTFRGGELQTDVIATRRQIRIEGLEGSEASAGA